jgi:hypothetical protein
MNKNKLTTIFGAVAAAAGAVMPYIPTEYQWIPQAIAALGVALLGYHAADKK